MRFLIEIEIEIEMNDKMWEGSMKKWMIGEGKEI